MKRSAQRKIGTDGQAPRATLVIATVAVALISLILVSSVPTGARGIAAPEGAVPSAAPLASPEVIPSGTIYLNQSQSLLTGTAYVGESWCELNGALACAGTPAKLPATFAVSPGSCIEIGWAVNASREVLPVSIFHSMILMNVTAANDSGTQTPVVVGPSSAGIARYFKACGGTAYWANYAETTNSVYDFVAPGLPTNASSVEATFGPWPGTSKVPANITAGNFGGSGAVQFVVPDNLSVRFLLPLSFSVTGSSGIQCDLGICPVTSYTFSAAVSSSLGTNGTGRIQYGTIGSSKGYALPGGAYGNWTVSYTNSTSTSTSGAGSFLLAGYSALTEVFVTYGVVTLILVLVLMSLAIIYREAHGSRRRRRR